jgi:4-hydroxy-4-methyl-2-oxoglutarate aldolase
MVDDSRLARLSRLDSATVHEAAGRVGNLDHRIRPIIESVHVTGRAVTASVQPGDNRAIHRAVLVAQPGDILVVDANGHIAGYWGEILAVAAQERGIVGLVIDGGCRDIRSLRKRGFPVWSAGVSVHGTVKIHPGTVNQPVSVGGVVVEPGDYVVADDDGVVVISASSIDDALDAAEKRVEKEDRIMSELQQGGNTLDLMGIAKEDGDVR